MQRRLLTLALLATFAWPWSAPALAADAAGPAKPAANPHRPASIKPVDINSASAAELKTLPGIGDAEAARIIKSRPYPSKTKLAVDKVLSEDAYRALKGRIVAIPPEPAKGRAVAQPGSRS